MNTVERKPTLTGAIKEAMELARGVSPADSWSTHEPQNAYVERTGSVSTDLRVNPIDTLSISFEATKQIDSDDHRFRTYYILCASAIKSLIYEELPTVARLQLQKAEVSASNGEELVIHIGDDDDVEDSWDDEDDALYAHKRTAQYRLNGHGSLVDYKLFESYDRDGEELVGTVYTEKFGEPSVCDLYDGVEHEGGQIDLKNLSRADIKNEFKHDLEFIDIVDQYSQELALGGQSCEEHARRMLAMVGFLRLQNDANYLINNLFD